LHFAFDFLYCTFFLIFIFHFANLKVRASGEAP
jgi:hypothetical protein